VPLTVMVGQTTLKVNAWFAFGGTPLAAMMFHAYGEADWVPAAGVPAMVAVLSPLSVNVTPAGSVPVRAIVLVGMPVVVTVNVWPGRPGRNVVLLALVMAGACVTKKLSRVTVVPFWTSTFLARNAPTALVPLSRTSVPLGAYTLAKSVTPVPVSTATVVEAGE